MIKSFENGLFAWLAKYYARDTLQFFVVHDHFGV